jgi:hypothetical protein
LWLGGFLIFEQLLHKRAVQWLWRPQRPAALATHEREVKPHGTLSASELGDPWEHLHRTMPVTGTRNSWLISFPAGRNSGHHVAQNVSRFSSSTLLTI